MSDASNVNAVDSMSIFFPQSPSANKAYVYNNVLNKVLVRVKVLLSHRDDNDTSNNRTIILSESELQKCISFHYISDDRECFNLATAGGHGPIGYDNNPFAYKDPKKNRYDKALRYETAFFSESEEVSENMGSDDNYSYASFWLNAHQPADGSSNNVSYPVYAKFSNGTSIPNSDTKKQNLLIESVKQLNYADQSNWVSPPSRGFDVNSMTSVTDASYEVTKYNTVTHGWENISGGVYRDTLKFNLANNHLIRNAVMQPDSSMSEHDFGQASGGGNYDENAWFFREYPVTRNKIGFKKDYCALATWSDIFTSKKYKLRFKSDYFIDVFKDETSYLLFYRFDLRIKDNNLKGGWGASNPRIIDVIDEYGNKGSVKFSLTEEGSHLRIM